MSYNLKISLPEPCFVQWGDQIIIQMNFFLNKIKHSVLKCPVDFIFNKEIKLLSVNKSCCMTGQLSVWFPCIVMVHVTLASSPIGFPALSVVHVTLASSPIGFPALSVVHVTLASSPIGFPTLSVVHVTLASLLIGFSVLSIMHMTLAISPSSFHMLLITHMTIAILSSGSPMLSIMQDDSSKLIEWFPCAHDCRSSPTGFSALSIMHMTLASHRVVSLCCQ